MIGLDTAEDIPMRWNKANTTRPDVFCMFNLKTINLIWIKLLGIRYGDF